MVLAIAVLLVAAYLVTSYTASVIRPAPAQTASSPDINRDGTVNVFDLVLVGRSMGARPGNAKWIAAGDLNNNRVIDSQDLDIVRAAIGSI